MNARTSSTPGSNGAARRVARPPAVPIAAQGGSVPLIVAPLARMSLQATLRNRRFAVAGLVCAIPLLLGAALMAADHTRAAEAGTGVDFQPTLSEPLAYLILGGTVPFLAMLLAGSIVADDVEDRTFSYVLVRPLRRYQIYLSRLLPAAGIMAALAVVQVVGFALLRLLSWSLYGRGAVETFYHEGVRQSMPAVELLLAQAGLGIVAAVLASVVFLALFSFVTVLTTKYHFLANILVFASVELLFGNLGGQGAGVVTATFHVRSILYAVGPLDTHYHAAAWWVAVPVLLGMTALWVWAAARQIGRRDFNVTSAAS